MNSRCLPHENDRLVVEFAGADKDSKHRRRVDRDRRGAGPRSPRRGPTSNDICYNCNKTGHWAADCREDSVSMTREIREGRCFNCGEKGHKRHECGTEKSSRYHRNYRSRRSYSRGHSSSRSRSMSSVSRSPKRQSHRRNKASRSPPRSKERSNTDVKNDKRDSLKEKTSKQSRERHKGD